MDGSCCTFCPVHTLENPTEQDVLRAECFCSCRGMQHEPSTQAVPAPAPQASAASSASMNAGRSNTLHRDLLAKVANRPPPNGKRKAPASPVAEPSSKRKAASKAEPEDELVKLTLVLGTKTQAIDAGQFSLPPGTHYMFRMQALHRHGYVHVVYFPANASPAEVSRIVCETFADIPAIRDGEVQVGKAAAWLVRLLRNISLGTLHMELINTVSNMPSAGKSAGGQRWTLADAGGHC
ncbi:hypothetical protein R3P38DRAFT_3459713 [Favolaschia claudopus]|uniref:Uncharacterized protein n=1 Tax=Favolaschia claudopus TaxID=2862362 RepID=A0AAV9ZID7_9AGAR